MSPIKHLYNCAVYLDGGQYVGQAETVKLPEVNASMQEVSGLGLLGKIEIPSGIEMMEASINWNGPYEAALLKSADPTAAIDLMIRGSLESHTSEGNQGAETYVATMKVIGKGNNFGEFKQNERNTVENSFTVYSFKLEIGGRNVIEFDVFSNTYKVGTKDVSRAFRVNLGLV